MPVPLGRGGYPLQSVLRCSRGAMGVRAHGSGNKGRLAARQPWQHQAMGQGFGSESPRAHSQTSHRPPARYLVLIDSGGVVVARLFIDSREQVAEFDAGTEEVAQMTSRLVPSHGAQGPEWDRALEGHSAAERAAADVYVLDV